jgi:hypothetical protein
MGQLEVGLHVTSLPSDVSWTDALGGLSTGMVMAIVCGFDCRIREPDGDVVAKLVPNRSDGTCGLPGSDGRESVPDPRPKA